MLKVTIIFDNATASPLSPQEFVEQYYLTEIARKDLKYIDIKQGEFEIKEKKLNKFKFIAEEKIEKPKRKKKKIRKKKVKEIPYEQTLFRSNDELELFEPEPDLAGSA